MVTRARERRNVESGELGISDKVVNIRRVAKVTKGGRHLRFNALVVVGDSQGSVGAGLGKADAVPDAIRKGNAIAKKRMIKIPLKGGTIPQQVLANFGASQVLLKPASQGVGIIAAGGVRAVLELAGIKDVVSKSLGSSNPINVVKATLKALQQLRNPQEELAKRKGLTEIKEQVG